MCFVGRGRGAKDCGEHRQAGRKSMKKLAIFLAVIFVTAGSAEARISSSRTCADGLIKNSGYVAAWQIPSDPLISFVHLDGIATHATARADSNKRSPRAATIRYAGPRTTSPDFRPSILASHQLRLAHLATLSLSADRPTIVPASSRITQSLLAALSVLTGIR
jgi:hypothetical protein